MTGGKLRRAGVIFQKLRRAGVIGQILRREGVIGTSPGEASYKVFGVVLITKKTILGSVSLSIAER